jgi:hypothetical protein
VLSTREYLVRGTTLPGLFLRILRAVTVFFWWLWMPIGALDLGFAMLAHQVTPAFVGVLILPLVALFIGLALHEAGHLYVLRRRTHDSDCGWLVMGIGQLGIARPPLPGPRDVLIVAAAGPLFPFIVGSATALLGWSVHAWPVFVCGLILCVHLVCLVPWWSDGRVAFRAFKEARTRR